MRKYDSYEERKTDILKQKADNLLSLLPEFCSDYFNSSSSLALSTRNAYARDLLIFFEFLSLSHPEIEQNSVVALEMVDSTIITEYESYLASYDHNGKKYTNKPAAIYRKLTILKAFFNYYYTNHLTKSIPDCFNAGTVSRRRPGKANVAEHEQFMENAINAVCAPDGLSDKQLIYINKTHKRDIAIIRVICSTGIKLSECVALNCEDINLDKGMLYLRTRNSHIPLDNKTLKSIENYLIYERKDKKNKSNDGNALFLSMQNKRMSGRAIEKMLKKYVDDGLKPTDIRNSRKIIEKSTR